MINSSRVCVQVRSVRIEAQFLPDDGCYVLACTVTIRNLGRASVQLLRYYRLIINGHGREAEVQGEDVVDVQSHIEPGEEYRHTGGTVIETPLDTIQGHYEMIDGQDIALTIDIPIFRPAVLIPVH